jgi:hypothetical protein
VPPTLRVPPADDSGIAGARPTRGHRATRRCRHSGTAALPLAAKTITTQLQPDQAEHRLAGVTAAVTKRTQQLDADTYQSATDYLTEIPRRPATAP